VGGPEEVQRVLSGELTCHLAAGCDPSSQEREGMTVNRDHNRGQSQEACGEGKGEQGGRLGGVCRGRTGPPPFPGQPGCPPVVVVCGGRNCGKSTFCRFLVNCLLDR